MTSPRTLHGRAVVASTALLIAVTACSSSRSDNPIDLSSPTTVAAGPSTTVVSSEMPGTTPTGDLAFLGPVRTVPVGDIDVGYRQFGSGPNLVMVVGQDSSMSYWGPDLPRR